MNVRSNILKLAPIVWDASSEQKRYDVAIRYDKFSLNLDEEFKKLTNSFLNLCDGLNYKSEGTSAMYKNTKDYDNDLEEEMQRRFQNTIYNTKKVKYGVS